MAQRGGKRPGAGRPAGSKDRATRDQGATIAELARKHCNTALDALVQIATGGESEAARVAAANALLDRGFGKPTQAIEHSGKIEHATVDHLEAARTRSIERSKGQAETQH